jgi:glycosyltransferase involved in cell wall biosynthesis
MSKTFCSHTIVRNGQPFIGPVLEQVLPYMDRCLVTISEKSDDGTLDVLNNLKERYPEKIVIMFENVSEPKDLTKERQKQIDMTTEDWILFLDDDDYWFPEDIEQLKSETEKDVDGFSCNPYQVIDYEHHDTSWNNKYFLKWFRNQPGLNYRNDWPRDLLYLNNILLYWKVNPRVPKVPQRYLHLSYLKDYSFRNEDWAKKFAFTTGHKGVIPVKYRLDLLK